MNVSKEDAIKLYARASRRCAFKHCQEVLTPEKDDETFILGETAHIVARSPGGPRGDETFPKEFPSDMMKKI